MKQLCYLALLFSLVVFANAFAAEKGYVIEEYDKNGDTVKSYSFDSSNQLILWNEHFLSDGRPIRTDTYNPSNKLIRVTVIFMSDGNYFTVSLGPDGNFIGKKDFRTSDKKPWIIAE